MWRGSGPSCAGAAGVLVGADSWLHTPAALGSSCAEQRQRARGLRGEHGGPLWAEGEVGPSSSRLCRFSYLLLLAHQSPVLETPRHPTGGSRFPPGPGQSPGYLPATQAAWLPPPERGRGLRLCPLQLSRMGPSQNSNFLPPGVKYHVGHRQPERLKLVLGVSLRNRWQAGHISVIKEVGHSRLRIREVSRSPKVRFSERNLRQAEREESCLY